MAQCYVGIVTRRGLESLFAETEDVVRFLDRRLYRRRPYPGISFWAVMPDEAAELIATQLRMGEQREALRTLQVNSLHLGSILPSGDRLSEAYHQSADPVK